MKRIILFFGLVVGIFLLSGCNNNPCGPGFYQQNVNGQMQCFPVPPGGTNPNANPWLYLQWQNGKGYTFHRTPQYKGAFIMNGSTDYWYWVTVCTQYGETTMAVKGSGLVGNIGIPQCTVELTYGTDITPWGNMFVVTAAWEKMNWYGTPCN